jgi:hypothetical protein
VRVIHLLSFVNSLKTELLRMQDCFETRLQKLGSAGINQSPARPSDEVSVFAGNRVALNDCCDARTEGCRMDSMFR